MGTNDRLRAEIEEARLMTQHAIKSQSENVMLQESNAELRRLLEEARGLAMKNGDIACKEDITDEERNRLAAENYDVWLRLNEECDALSQKVDSVLKPDDANLVNKNEANSRSLRAMC